MQHEQPNEQLSDADPDLTQSAAPDTFAVNDDDSANWLVRRIIEARNYSARCAEWCEREQARAARTEQFFLWRYGPQLVRWLESRIAEDGGRRKSVNLPAGTVGFRSEPAKVVIDDEGAVVAWCKEHKPDLVQMVERLSKSGLNAYIKQTGELPEKGVRIESEREKFYVK